ncbi:MAG: C40 family peptidase [Bacteroidales bacterium]|nr:C40 family peptidase [Bacteroidales bacterium]MBR5028491.1 C40 family peptidase [Bacteroidales bacterium]
MNKIGICHLPLAPMRAAADDTSEMVSQILFGQSFDILEQTEKWTLVCNHDDGYKGYIGNKQFVIVGNDQFDTFNTSRKIVDSHNVSVYFTNKKITFCIPFGSILPEKNTFRLGNYEYRHNFQPREKTLLQTAQSFLNAPYLWGGKTLFGIDCSGFTQTLFSAFGIQLPRDASQQADKGVPVGSLDGALPGDLLFFDNDKGRIIHVGILLEKELVIHASGCVRIDNIDKKGIFNNDMGQYTHHLASVRRFGK